MKLIEFTAPATPYAAGDVAGVEDALADKFIAAGVAKAAEQETPVVLDDQTDLQDRMISKTDKKS